MVETRRKKQIANATHLAADGTAGDGINDRINNHGRVRNLPPSDLSLSFLKIIILNIYMLFWWPQDAIKAPYKDVGIVDVDVDEEWRRYYRNKLEEERSAQGRTLFHKIARRLWLVQYHFFISMGHSLFDPWEAVVYTVLFFSIVYVMIMALLRSWPLTWALSRIQVLFDNYINVDGSRIMTV